MSVASTACVSPDSVGIQARLCSAISSPVTTATTPRSAAPAKVSIPEPCVRERAPEYRHVEHFRERDVVEVIALAPDQPLVLFALDALADELNTLCAVSISYASFIGLPAHFTALTMFW